MQVSSAKVKILVIDVNDNSPVFKIEHNDNQSGNDFQSAGLRNHEMQSLHMTASD